MIAPKPAIARLACRHSVEPVTLIAILILQSPRRGSFRASPVAFD
jgi:hypothetical protein